jgi:polar amino acid transport system substrate-binding protein
MASISTPTLAQTCNEEYVVKSGESLSRIANRVYGDLQKWTVIYNVNLNIIGSDPNLILAGQVLRIPCLEETNDNLLTESTTETTDESTSESSDAATSAASVADVSSSAEEESAAVAVEDLSQVAANDSVEEARTRAPGDAIRFLTGNDYAPFTDQSLPDDGLITDIVDTAFSNAPSPLAFEIDWVDDWSVHLTELLANLDYDMGFPWLRPDCNSTPEEFRCQNFEFSNPAFEMLILLFTHKDRPLVFNSDADIAGAVLCRPKGYYTHDLEKDGRLWLTNNVIELQQPDTIKDCFDRLVEGTVDAVALNEFTGRSAIADFNLKDEIVALENKPLSIEGLHVVVHKDHPRSRELISLFNKNMAALQLSDEYNQIIDKHFRNYWISVD